MIDNGKTYFWLSDPCPWCGADALASDGVFVHCAMSNCNFGKTEIVDHEQLEELLK